MHRHQLDAFRVVLQERCLICLSPFGFLLKIFHKGAKRGRSRCFISAREVYKTSNICQHTLSTGPQRETGVSTRAIEQVVYRRSHWPVVALSVEVTNQIECKSEGCELDVKIFRQGLK